MNADQKWKVHNCCIPMLPRESLAFTMTCTTNWGTAFWSRFITTACPSSGTAGLTVQRELPIPVYFRGTDVGKFKADLLVNDCIRIELKAAQNLDKSHEAQVMNYLRATDLEAALLLNFGSSRPQFRRFVFENSNKKIRVHPRSSAVGSL